MLELRWVVDELGESQLQFRIQTLCTDAYGAYCGIWSDWHAVPTVTGTIDKRNMTEISYPKLAEKTFVSESE